MDNSPWPDECSWAIGLRKVIHQNLCLEVRQDGSILLHELYHRFPLVPGMRMIDPVKPMTSRAAILK